MRSCLQRLTIARALQRAAALEVCAEAEQRSAPCTSNRAWPES